MARLLDPPASTRRSPNERPRTSRYAAQLCLAIAASASTACAGHSFLRNEGARNIAEANYKEPLMRVELAHGEGYYLANALRKPGALYGDPRRYMIVDVGYPNPVAAFSTKPLTRDPLIPYDACNDDPPASHALRDWRCQLTVQLTVPVAFYLFWDAFTDNNPIINTDYTFGVDLSARAAVWSGTEQRAGLYWGHISTHIGDEYILSARRIPGAPFPRINVSYFPWRANLGNRWYYGNLLPGAVVRSYIQVAGEIEGSCLGSCNDGSYYDLYPTETAGVPIARISSGAEATLTMDWRIMKDWRRPNGIPNSESLEPPSINLGLLVGNRRIFPYLNPDSSNHHGLAINGTVGYRFPASLRHGTTFTEIYLRGYRGPNPYGQLRNQPHFYLIGLGMKLFD